MSWNSLFDICIVLAIIALIIWSRHFDRQRETIIRMHDAPRIQKGVMP